jgi:predicted RNase H-like HicB family nuclease
LKGEKIQMAKYVYPAIFTQKDSGLYSIMFPDIPGCVTTGEDLQDGLDMANDVLCLVLYDMEQSGTEIPTPSNINAVKHDAESFVTFVSCDTDWYRRFYESKSVKKTLTIPAWLNDMAERNALNFSQILQDALRQTLHVD